MKSLLTKIVFLTFGITMCLSPLQAQKAKVVVLKPDKFKSQIEQTAHPVIIDVRPVEFFEEGRLLGAINLDPYDPCFVQNVQSHCAPSDSVFVYCKLGKTSKAATKELVKHGFLHVYNLKGGMLAWDKKR